MVSGNISGITTHPAAVPDHARFLLAAWCSLLLILALPGNCLVLFAIRRGAIKLNQLSITLVQHIAFSDLGTTIFAILPTLVSLIYNGRPYGTTLCYVLHFMQVLSFVSAVLLICAFHISKLRSLINPLRALSGNNLKRRVFITTGIWIFAAITPTIQLAVDLTDVSYDRVLFKCAYGFRARIWEKLLPALIIPLGIIPNVVVMVTTVCLLVVARRVTGRTRRHGVLTSVYVGLTYLVSSLPVLLYNTLYRNFIAEKLSYDTKTRVEDHLTMFSYFSTFVNAVSNVFVYYFSLESFNRFVKRRYARLTTSLSGHQTDIAMSRQQPN